MHYLYNVSHEYSFSGFQICSSSTLMFVATSQDFFDARIMEAIRKQLSVFSAGHNTNCDVSGNGIAFQHAVSFTFKLLLLLCSV